MTLCGQDVNSGEDCGCLRDKGCKRMLCTFHLFSCEHITALKIKGFLVKNCSRDVKKGHIWELVGTRMEKAMAPHSSTPAWKIPWTEEPDGLQSTGLLRVGHDWATSLSCIGEGNGNPLQCSCLENPRDGGAWWAAVYGVTQSRTWLKWLSSSSRN